MRTKKTPLLPALERNLLKYRSLEMVSFLFHAEDLKSFLIESIRASEMISKKPLLPLKVAKGKLMEEIWNFLVAEDILTREECDEVSNLIEYRNDIAHRVHLLTIDLGHPHMRDILDKKYNYEALHRLRALAKKITKGFQGKFVMRAGLSGAYFEATEVAMEYELGKLHKQIVRLAKARYGENT